MNLLRRRCSFRFTPLLAVLGACAADPPARDDAGRDPRDGAGGAGGLSGGTGGSGAYGGFGGFSTEPAPGFRVVGRDLIDRCGTKVVLRGINEMVVWSSGKDGDPEFTEIAKTGANVVRIVWTVKDGTAAELDRALANAVAAQLIPMPELHDATGDRTKIQAMVDHWIRPDVLNVVRKYEQVLLVNIANEAGDGAVNATQFRSDYETAILRMRTAGYRTPLVIDAPQWGQNIDVLQAAGPALIEADPDHNILLSVHTWWSDAAGTRVMAELQESVTAGLPLIVGEFAHHSVSGCSAAPFAYRVLLAKAEELGVGWLAWSWGGVKNNDCKMDDPFDMTTAGTFDTLAGWGLDVAVSDPNSIKNTSMRPPSLTMAACP